MQTRSEIVEIEIANPDAKLLSGMYATATIPIRRQGLSFVVPGTAVVTNMEKQFIILVKDGSIVQHLEVEKGEEQNGRVEIFGNLHEGDTIINVASDEIRANTKVKISLTDKN